MQIAKPKTPTINIDKEEGWQPNPEQSVDVMNEFNLLKGNEGQLNTASCSSAHICGPSSNCGHRGSVQSIPNEACHLECERSQ